MSRPVGISVVAIIGYAVSSCFAILAALVILAPATFVKLNHALNPRIVHADAIPAKVRLTLTALYIVVSVVNFALSRGLWHLRGWAWRWTILLAGIALVSGIDSFAGRLVAVVIAFYLLSTNVQGLFHGRQPTSSRT